MKSLISIFSLALAIGWSPVISANAQVNVTQKNNNPSRDGLYIDAVFTPDNTATGANALAFNHTGGGNTATGVQALFNNTTGSANVALGFNAGAGVTTADNVICIGAAVGGANVSCSCYIGNIFGVTSSGGAAVFVNSDGKLGTATSSKRFKEAIQPMDRDSEALYSLQPITFRYKKEIDPEGRSQFGLVAEDVEKVNPDLVVRDKEGKPYSVRYEQVNAMLLNEFLKEHGKIAEQCHQIDRLNSRVAKQEATIAQQQKEFQATTVREENAIRALTTSVKEQAAQIQKVSAQIGISKSGPQVVAKNP